jgi:uncharacterized delta-60 repeat protein
MNKAQYFKQLIWKASLLTALISLMTFSVVLAAPGDLDSTFDGDGWVINYVVPAAPERWESVQGIAIQSDEKIVAAGYSAVPSTSNYDFAVTRYNTNGTLDATFSGDGMLITNFGAKDKANDVAVQSNGKIVVAGYKCVGDICDLALARYNPNGKLDVTFSGDGKQVTDFGGGDNGANALAIQSNGKIIVAGWMWNGTDSDFAIYRYNVNGTLDATFSGDGKVRFGFGAGRQDYATDLVIQSNGKIVVAGDTGDANDNNYNFAIARLNPNGSLDATFSADGRQTANFGSEEYVYGVALQADGKIVLAGEKNTPTVDSSALARFTTDGSLDATFSGTGKKVFSIVPGANSRASDLSVQADGKIVVMGFTEGDISLTRLNGGGSFDTSLSGDGKLTLDFGAYELGTSLAIQPSDGRYLLGGYTLDGSQYDFALVRVLP